MAVVLLVVFASCPTLNYYPYTNQSPAPNLNPKANAKLALFSTFVVDLSCDWADFLCLVGIASLARNTVRDRARVRARVRARFKVGVRVRVRVKVRIGVRVRVRVRVRVVLS